ncbi:zinc finger C2HC domain-containing protein 1A-like [Argonauta hians]
MEEDAEVANMVLEPCEFCGRKFNPSVLPKHQRICAKVSTRKRKVFDSTKQRAEALNLSVQQVKQNLKKEIPVPKSNWRTKHQDFINSIRNAKGVSQALAEGKPLPPPPPPLANADYIQCDYCERRFNAAAAERHIAFCREQHLRMKARQPPKQKSKSQIESNRQRPGRIDSLNMKSNSTTYSNSSGKHVNAKLKQENSGLRRPGFTSQIPTSSSENSNKNMYQRNNEIHDNNVNYAPTGPALRTGRTDKTYTDAKRDAKSGNGTVKAGTGLPVGRMATGQRAMPNTTYNRGVTNRYNKPVNCSNNNNSVPSPTATTAGQGGQFQNNSSSSSPSDRRPQCHNCDSVYPITTAKYCCECGMKRLNLS